MLSQELIQSIQADYDFVGSSYDKQGNFIGHHYLYSKVVQLFPTQVEEVKKLFPNFNVTQLYLNYHIIGFNKTL